jgi:RHS repeat-associated protein
MQYTYDACGRISRRKDTKWNQWEDYTYDGLGRLTSCTVNDTLTHSFTYAPNGNITRNGRLGGYDYVYGSSRPHAVTQVYDEGGLVPSARCDVIYNSRNRPATISEDGSLLELSYGSGLQREKTVMSIDSTELFTTHHISDDCEFETTPGGSRYIDYIVADGKTVALHVRNTTADADTVYYVMTDLLGSWELVVKPNRNLVQSCHFDPWGNRMRHGFWTLPHPDSTFRFRRGFTGHEHYDRFGIINMNARLYEPAIARFFSPDPQVQNLQVVSRGGSMLAFEVFLQFPYSHVTGGNFAFLV